MYYGNDDVRLEEMSASQIGSGVLLSKIAVSGIYGSDVMESYRCDIDSWGKNNDNKLCYA